MSATLRKNLLVLFLLGGVFHYVCAQTGFPLYVYDGENNEPLIGVNIYTADQSWSTATDIDGKAELPNLNIARLLVNISVLNGKFFNPVIKKIIRPSHMARLHSEH